MGRFRDTCRSKSRSAQIGSSTCAPSAKMNTAEQGQEKHFLRPLNTQDSEDRLHAHQNTILRLYQEVWLVGKSFFDRRQSASAQDHYSKSLPPSAQAFKRRAASVFPPAAP
jgi:hypothetical protein